MADAMIRGVLGIDPDTLSDTRWAAMAMAAEAVERRRADITGQYMTSHLAEILTKAFSRR